MRRTMDYVLLAGAVIYNTVVSGCWVAIMIVAVADLVTGEVPDPFPNAVVEVGIHAFVAVLVLWGAIQLWLARRWRKREGLKQHRVLARLFLVSLPIYGVLYLWRTEFR